MSMSMYVDAIIPPDEEWKRMKAVYDACESAKVQIPDAVADYFNDECPDADGVVININRHEATTKWDDRDMQSGFQVDLSKLPKHVKFIRFYNSY